MTNEKIYVVTVQALEQDENGKITPIETIERKVNHTFHSNVRTQLVREEP